MKNLIFGSSSKEKSVVASFRTFSFNIWLNFSSTAQKNAIEKHVLRADADLVTFTETNDTDYAYVQSQYAQYGYNYFAKGSSRTSLDVMFMSKYPILNYEEIPMSGRYPLYCEVDINGYIIGVVSHHNASWCSSAPCNTSASQMPAEPMAHDRMVQLYQTLDFLNGKKANNPSLKGFIIQGDWNDDILNTQVGVYTSAPSGGTSLPAYLSYPLNNSQFPLKPLEYYNGNMNLDLSTDLNGSTHTIWENTPNAAFTFPLRMDYIAFSDDIQLVGGEILNSEVDANTGLTKYGAVLTSTDSRTASDHKAVFADLEILD